MSANENTFTNDKPHGALGRLSEKLSASRQRLGRGLGDLLLGQRELDKDLLEEVENLLLSADVGIPATQALTENITERGRRADLDSANAVYKILRQAVLDLINPRSQPLAIAGGDKPFVIMVVGVNGVGKTTTCSKLAQRLQQEGHKVMLVAADTFRAAAVEQLQIWGKRIDVPVIAQHTGADAGAVVHDAMQSAQARGCDVVIVDTAGRQHTQTGLMDELIKVKRVITKSDPDAPQEVLLILDAATGQNALSQLKHFHEAVGITGLTLTKLDGTAKGGILIALAREGEQPIRFIGIGEKAEDLRVFNAEEFVDALLPEASNE